MNRAALALVCLCALAFGASAETSLDIQGYYSFPNHAAVDSSGFAPVIYGTLGGGPTQREVGSSWGGVGAKAILASRTSVPFLAGGGGLTKGNNLALKLSGELTPISASAFVEATLTPLAFLQFSAGAGGGTGWGIGFPGLGIVDPDSGNIVQQDFGGLVYKAWCAGTFQFDFAALLPGDWHHVVLLASQSLEYRAYTGAGADTAWTWEADDAMDFNGLRLLGSYLLGYRMPLALDLTGILLWTEGYLGSAASSSTMASGGWGSDFTYFTFGPIFDFALGQKSSIVILPQFKTGIAWTAGSAMAKYFADRVFQGPYLYFYRVAFDYSLKL